MRSFINMLVNDILGLHRFAVTIYTKMTVHLQVILPLKIVSAQFILTSLNWRSITKIALINLTKQIIQILGFSALLNEIPTMDPVSLLDPYEQQLLKVFSSHDIDNCGSLDRDGLIQLCLTLQLEEQGGELIRCLISEKRPRASFSEFKEALLNLLGKSYWNRLILFWDWFALKVKCKTIKVPAIVLQRRTFLWRKVHQTEKFPQSMCMEVRNMGGEQGQGVFLYGFKSQSTEIM